MINCEISVLSGLDLKKEAPFQQLRTGSEDTMFSLGRSASDGF